MFFYKNGDIVTTDPWNKPSVKTFNKWLKEWSKTPNVSDYSVYLTGGFCQNYFFNKNIDTWDIDVLLVADSKKSINYYSLKNILKEGLKIGFKNKLLIDIYLVGEIPTNEKFSYKKIRSSRHIIKKTDTEYWQWSFKGEITELIPGLYQSIKDPTEEYNKYLSKNYEVPCKQVDLQNN